MFGKMIGLRYAILGLLNSNKKGLTGVDIIKEFGRMTNGVWYPSAGAIYWQLNSLVDEGYITRGKDGKYRITKSGEQFLEEFSTPLAEWVFKVFGISNMLEEVANYILSHKDSLSNDERKRIKEISNKLAKI